jgi:hypothetical protein
MQYQSSILCNEPNSLFIFFHLANTPCLEFMSLLIERRFIKVIKHQYLDHEKHAQNKIVASFTNVSR